MLPFSRDGLEDERKGKASKNFEEKLKEVAQLCVGKGSLSSSSWEFLGEVENHQIGGRDLKEQN